MTTLTLVTSVLNGRPHIDEMLASVLANPQIEHLVIDAGSSDGTLDILRARSDLRLIERPGLPLYDAWNEALAAAQGDYVLFLNADDLLVAGALDRLLPHLKAPLDILCAEAEAFDNDASHPPRYSYRGAGLTGLTWETLLFGAPLINAKIFRRTLLLDAGGFDTSLPVAADRDLLLRLAAMSSHLRIDCSPTLMYRYRIHAGSKTLQQTAKARAGIAREHARIAARLMTDSTLVPHVSEMAAHWAAHEAAVLAVRSLQAGDVRTSLAAFREVCRPRRLAHVAAAREIRRAYAGRLRDVAAQMRRPPAEELRA